MTIRNANDYLEQMRASEMGLIRSIDELGRLVIPKEYRNALGILPYQPLAIVRSGGFIIVWKDKAIQRCHCCGADNNLQKTSGGEVILCADCLESMMGAGK